MPAQAPAVPTGGAGAAVASMPESPPPTPTSTDLYQVAAAEALQPRYVPGRAAGYQPAQRTGALPADVAARQREQSAAADADLLQQTELAREAETEMLRKEADRLRVAAAAQRADAEQAAREAQARKARYQSEQRDVENMQIAADLSHEGPLKNVLTVLGSALMGYIGSDAGIRLTEKRIDEHVRAQLAQQGSKLRRLADAIGSEEQAIAHAKERYYGALAMRLDADLKANRAQFAGKQTGMVLSALKRQQISSAHEAETQSLGKETEVYQQAQRGGIVRGDMVKAAGLLEKGEKAAQARQEADQKGKPKPEKQQALNEMRSILATLERGKQSGALTSVTGWQSKVPLGPAAVLSKALGGPGTANEVQQTFGGLPPDQQEQLTAIERLQAANLMAPAREPNSVKVQEMIKNIGVAQNDRDIDNMINLIRERIRLAEGEVDAPAPIEVR